MLGWVSVLVCGLAACLMFNVGKGAGILALIVLGVNFWSLGIIHNYGPGRVHDSYKRFIDAQYAQHNHWCGTTSCCTCSKVGRAGFGGTGYGRCFIRSALNGTAFIRRIAR